MQCRSNPFQLVYFGVKLTFTLICSECAVPRVFLAIDQIVCYSVKAVAVTGGEAACIIVWEGSVFFCQWRLLLFAFWPRCIWPSALVTSGAGFDWPGSRFLHTVTVSSPILLAQSYDDLSAS